MKLERYWSQDLLWQVFPPILSDASYLRSGDLGGWSRDRGLRHVLLLVLEGEPEGGRGEGQHQLVVRGA